MRPTWRGVYRVQSRMRWPRWIRPAVPTTPSLAATLRNVPTMERASRGLRPWAIAWEARVPDPRRAIRAAARVWRARALRVARRVRLERIMRIPLGADVRWLGGSAVIGAACGLRGVGRVGRHGGVVVTVGDADEAVDG